jgi:hypothetical protein
MFKGLTRLMADILTNEHHVIMVPPHTCFLREWADPDYMECWPYQIPRDALAYVEYLPSGRSSKLFLELEADEALCDDVQKGANGDVVDNAAFIHRFGEIDDLD